MNTKKNVQKENRWVRPSNRKSIYALSYATISVLSMMLFLIGSLAARSREYDVLELRKVISLKQWSEGTNGKAQDPDEADRSENKFIGEWHTVSAIAKTGFSKWNRLATRSDGDEVLLSRGARVKGAIQDLVPVTGDSGGPCWSLILPEEFKKRIFDFTTKHQGKYVAVILDGRIQQIIQVRRPIRHTVVVPRASEKVLKSNARNLDESPRDEKKGMGEYVFVYDLADVDWFVLCHFYSYLRWFCSFVPEK